MSIEKGTLVSWKNKNGVKGSGFALSGEDDGHVIVAVNNFGNETPTGTVAEKDGDKHTGYHHLVLFAASDLTDVVAEQEAQAKKLEAERIAAKEAAAKAVREQALQQVAAAEKVLAEAKASAAKVTQI